MHSFTLASLSTALLAASAVAAPAAIDASNKFLGPDGKGTFNLIGLAIDGALGYGGQWVTGFHTGAGENVAVMTQNQSEAGVFKFHAKTGDIYFYGGSGPDNSKVPASLGFPAVTPYMSNAPAGYNIVTINVGYANSNISFSTYDNEVDTPYPYASLAVCYVNGTSPYFSVGPQVQMFWREPDVALAAPNQCADVELKAVFNHGSFA